MSTLLHQRTNVSECFQPAHERKDWLAGKHCLITGASSGIGRALAFRAMGLCRRLTLVSRNTDSKLDNLGQELTEFQESARDLINKTEIKTCTLDVRNYEGTASLIDRIYNQENECVEAFINCSGGSHIYGNLETMGSDDIDQIFDVNAKAPIYWLWNLLPLMKRNSLRAGDLKRAHILMLSSRSGERALSRLSVYAAAKGSIEKLVESLRTEYARFKIVFSLINPGSINTPFTANWSEEARNAHNAESMDVESAITPIFMALNSQFAVNRISYESTEQWLNEPGVLKPE